MASAINGFRFISPGVAFREIDQSARSVTDEAAVGPVVIGRSVRGPAMRPVKVTSLEEFTLIFGNPSSGLLTGGDVWRTGGTASPTYGAYAAEAWLKNSAPLTFVRLLGEESPNATTAGKAGWETAKTLDVNAADNGGAYGLFIVDDHLQTADSTGSLAAIFYLQEGSITLKGNDKDGDAVTGSAVLVKSTAANKTFRAVIKDASDAVILDSEFNFTPTSDKYIRKVFNTNPVLTHPTLIPAATRKTYWLGETFERHLDQYVTGSTAGLQLGTILGLAGSHSGDVDGGFFRYGLQSAKTGWFFGQDVNAAASTFDPRNNDKLFRFHSLYGGEWDNKNVKISITDIKPSTNPDDPYGTFSVLVRSASDNDGNPVILEQFNNLSLNPSSPNFIGVKIGDKEMVWDETNREYREYGTFDNQSTYIRVELDDAVLEGIHNPYLLPFGVFGPLRHKPFAIVSGSTTPMTPNGASAFAAAFVQGAGAITQANTEGTELVNVGDNAYQATFVFPSIPLRASSLDGTLPNPKRAYFGIQPTKTATSLAFDEGYADYTRPLSGDYKDEGEGTYLEYSWIFTLDDLSGSSATAPETSPAVYVSGSRAAGNSLTAVFGWESLLNNNNNKFTAPMFGGHDGVDITELDPFRNSKITSNPTNETDSVYYTYKKAIDMVRDPEVLDHNIAVVPGLTNEGLTGYLAQMCENRSDSLAIIDPAGGYVPRSESANSASQRSGDTTTVVNNMKSRALNTSYACSYEPWVQISDSLTSARVFIPPSIVALGTMANTDREAAPWFAPAGFVRGGLTGGAGGLTVTSVSRQLKSGDRDDLYAVGVNSIASFPGEGIVVWGQKTHLKKASALDRVNVRRLMNYLKKEISRVAVNTLFEPNVRDTWANFVSKATPILEDVKSRFGINRYRLILDETTTTPDIQDENKVYAKIIIEPTKTIEFIAIDFILTNTGASFND